jgi:hypothetical protein
MGKPYKKLKSERLFFRPAKEILIPYIKAHCKAIDSLKSITVGPKNNIDIATAGVSLYCRSKGIAIRNRQRNLNIADEVNETWKTAKYIK